MSDKNHEVLDLEGAKSWLLTHVNSSSKANCFFDAKFIDSEIVDFLNSNSVLEKFSTVIVNGVIPNEQRLLLNENRLPNLGVISKKIESPFPFGVSIGRKAYLYIDQTGNFRSSKDDQNLGRVLESIHRSFESLSWK